MRNSKPVVGITYDLREAWLAMGYSEDETAEFDRVDTIESIAATLNSLGYEADPIGNVRQLAQRLVQGDRWDVVFNICEGMHGLGREAQAPALQDAYEIPHVFSDSLVCALTLHKGMTKDVVRAAGVRTPDYFVVNEPADIANVTLPFPLFAKPVAEGTGKGVSRLSKITSRTQLDKICRTLLRTYNQPVLVERFLPGREFTVGILGTGERAEVLGVLEVSLMGDADAQGYTYENKQQWEGRVTYRLVDDEAARAAAALALSAYRVLGCRDAGRVDVREDDEGHPSFIEANPLAGLNPEISDLSILARLAGMSFPELIARIVASASERVRTESSPAAPACAAS